MTRWGAIAATLPQHQPIGKYTAARIGGPADFLFVADSATTDSQLVEVFTAAQEAGVPVRVIGGGANILVSDAGVRGLVIVNRAAGLAWSVDGVVEARAGTGLLALARAAATRGWRGFEWAIGVPGTVGGALVNNAGAHGSDMAASVTHARIAHLDGTIRRWTPDALAFAYRSSALKHHSEPFLVLEVGLRFEPDDPDAIHARMAEYTAHRRRTQPTGASLGSVFKNPPGGYAGRLIESCGLKGFQIGTAQVSPLHANFFLSDGHTRAADYRALIEHVQAVVQQRCGVLLEPEIQFVGEW
ncbi:MAG: UDP-N-acetylmuramate dehydrogenase [Anaerolineae bacterium]